MRRPRGWRGAEVAIRSLELNERATRAFRPGDLLPTHQRLLTYFAIDLGEYLRALTACELDAAIERCRRVAEESQVLAVALSVELMQAGRARGDGRLDDLADIVRRMSEASSLVGGFENTCEERAARHFAQADVIDRQLRIARRAS